MRAGGALDRGDVSDRVDPITRSRIMSRVRGRNTGLERSLRRALWTAGVRGYRCHRRDIFGQPDLAWPRLRLAVFVDSAWWHGHPSRYVPGRLPGRWDEKIQRNRERDAEVTERLMSEGWRVVRIWDFEIAADAEAQVERVMTALRAARGNAIGRTSSPAHPEPDFLAGSRPVTVVEANPGRRRSAGRPMPGSRPTRGAGARQH